MDIIREELCFRQASEFSMIIYLLIILGIIIPMVPVDYVYIRIEAVALSVTSLLGIPGYEEGL